MVSHLLAQFGTVPPPGFLANFAGGNVEGVPILLNIFFKTLIVFSGVFAIFNIIMAGLSYISAGGDPKKISDAGSKITFSIIGVLVAAGAFVIAGVIGRLIFGDANAILQLRFYHP